MDIVKYRKLKEQFEQERDIMCERLCIHGDEEMRQFMSTCSGCSDSDLLYDKIFLNGEQNDS